MVSDEMMLNVLSSNIKSIGYNDNKLRIDFVSGGSYEYQDVPLEIKDEFLKAVSVGSFFHKNIRNKYKYIQLNTKNPIIEQGQKVKDAEKNNS